MIRFSGAFLLTLPVAAALTAGSALAQQLPPPGIYEERLPPIMGNPDDEDELPPPRRATRPGQVQRDQVLPYPDDAPALPPPTGLFGTPERRQVDYGISWVPNSRRRWQQCRRGRPTIPTRYARRELLALLRPVAPQGR